MEISIESMIAIIIIMPLLGALTNGLYSFFRLPLEKFIVYFIGCGSIFVSFILSLLLFFHFTGAPELQGGVSVTFFQWVHLGEMSLDVAFWIDSLTLIMMLVVTGVGFVIHFYSTGYMAHDPGSARFFSYLNLFIFAMLLLVMADNLIIMFVGWEGVGLCSYLLIGFWFGHKPNAVAGMKAFIMNRIGDFGFLIGMMILYWALAEAGHPTMTFSGIKEAVPLLSGWTFAGVSVITIVTLLFFVGATGKSAQIPLYVWLPDAMAGPTPVSALIHAATMVTAGVYMIGRLNFLYIMSPVTLNVVATVGVITALFAGTIAITQNDIKKILAYSTVSQLGLMFVAMGTASFAIGIFHLVTHAFFKACLFLGAGSVIHAMSKEQDIQKMGGLAKKLPITFVTFLIASLALAGIFPLAGFFSKDEILWNAFNTFPGLWAVGFAGALITGFYTFRLIALAFFGKCRAEDDVKKHIHESPKTMTTPLVILATLSLFGGFLGVSPALSHWLHWPLPDMIGRWLRPVLGEPEGHVKFGHGVEALLIIISVVFVAAACVTGYIFFTKRIDIPKRMASKYQKLHHILVNKYFIDEFYDRVFVRGLLALERFLAGFDQKVIDGFVNLTGTGLTLLSKISGKADAKGVDGTVNLIANSTLNGGRRLQGVQTGRIQNYVYVLVGGLVLILIWKMII